MTAVLTPERQADRLMLNRGRDGGVSFARRARQTHKADARNQVLKQFSTKAWGRGRSLSILTMPGLAWTFEKALLRHREHGKGVVRPRLTYVTAIESSRPIYTAALRNAPGAPDTISTAVECPPFAASVCRTLTVRRYYLTTLERMASEDPWLYDAAWIDLCGPLTEPRVLALKALWARIDHRLIFTSLAARWPAPMGLRIREAGGLAALLAAELPGSLIADDARYMDTSPMSQITIVRQEARA